MVHRFNIFYCTTQVLATIAVLFTAVFIHWAVLASDLDNSFDCVYCGYEIESELDGVMTCPNYDQRT